MVAMVADFSKWKFNQWPFFPEKLSGSEGNGEKIGFEGFIKAKK